MSFDEEVIETLREQLDIPASEAREGIPKEIIEAFQEMADLTRPKCGECRVPLSCCSPEYCVFTLNFAAEKSIELATTDHPTLPLMGKQGCTAPPHLRPLCTLHVCEWHYIKSVEFAEAYFDLRARLSQLCEGYL